MISVVMVSYLGSYPGSRENSEIKFVRAVGSFLQQDLQESELIIVSDGCQKTVDLYEQHFKGEDRVRLIQQPKANGWPGAHRQLAIEEARYNWITYLDSDDVLMPDRLSKLMAATVGRSIIIDSAYTAPLNNKINMRRFNKTKQFTYNDIEWAQYSFPSIGGTYQLCHPKNTKGVKWQTRIGRGEDAIFVKNLIATFSKGSGTRLNDNRFLTEIGGYLICHHPKWGWDV